MIFGVLKDIKEGESRVICTPMEVASIAAAGHTVLVEKDAGKGAGFGSPVRSSHTRRRRRSSSRCPDPYQSA